MNALLINEILKCKNDIEHFASYLNIKLTNTQKKLLSFYDEKNDSHTISFDHNEEQKIATSLYILWYITFNSNKTAVILSNTYLSASFSFSRIVYLYEKLPYFLKVELKSLKRTSIVLQNNSRIIAGAITPSSIRGLSFSLLVIDQFNLPVDRNIFTEFIMCVLPCMHCMESKIIYTTTESIHNCMEFLLHFRSIILNSNIIVAPEKENDNAE